MARMTSPTPQTTSNHPASPRPFAEPVADGCDLQAAVEALALELTSSFGVGKGDFSVGRLTQKSLFRRGTVVRRVDGVAFDPANDAIGTRGRVVRPDSSSLSRSSGTGMVAYEHLGTGLYRLDDVLVDARGTRRCYHLVVVGDAAATLSDQDRDSWHQLLCAMFPGDMAEANRARESHRRESERCQRLLQQIQCERDYHVPVTEGEWTADPVYPKLPDWFPPYANNDELIAEWSLPVKWRVSGFRDAVGETAEEAIAVARRMTNERERNAHAARRQADHAGLPALQGSARQVRWAEQIRAICRDRELVKEATLKRAKTAKYWIDHFKDVTRK